MKTALNLVLLAVAAALVVVGLVTYPHIPGGALAAMIVTASLLLAPVGRRTAAGVAR